MRTIKKLTIGAEEFSDQLGSYLSQANALLEQEHGIRLLGEQFKRGNYTFFTYRIPEVQTTEKAVQALAEAAALFITEVWERRELERIVADDFYYYNADEVEYIAGLSVQILADLKDEAGEPLRLLHIAEQLREGIKPGSELVIEGFLRFRLQALREDLHRVVEQAIDEYLIDLEYQEFIKLLRYFLAAQEPTMPLLHMIIPAEDDIRLFDGEGQAVSVEQLLHVPELSIEDMMSSLISLAPERLLIHLPAPMEKQPSYIDTVQKVFQEKASLCTGCPLCHALPKREYDGIAQKVTNEN
ncbi:MAG: putative sporulation protein YtxC [Tumebacillaceae bacterium]